MRTFIRTTTITMLFVLGVMSVWSFIRQSNVAKNVQAAPEGIAPAYCVQPELPGIKELLSKTTDSNAKQRLSEKKESLEQAELECIERAKANPPAQKPKDLVGILLPTPVPEPTPTMQMGIQTQELLPVGNFIPTTDGPNLWVGIIKGKVLEVATGSLREEDENWQQNHPEWVTQGPQGALYIVINRDGSNSAIYPTPSRNGSVYLVSSCGNVLNLEATDGTIFSFDVAILSYVENTSSCSTP